MKKIAASIGLVALGATSLQAAYTPDMGPMQTTKWWSVSGTLRGFYDDNYNTTSGSAKRDSFGFEVSPTISVNIPLQQTEIGLRYTYGLYYYQDRENLDQNPVDQNHQFDLWVDHAFSERWKARVTDSFVIAQEPELLSSGPVSLPTRTKGDNLRNTGAITLDTQWTRLFSTEIGYQNTYYNYDQHGGTGITPSLSGLLDRIENLAWINFEATLRKDLVVFVGYQYGQNNYIGDEVVVIDPIYGPLSSNSRDSRSHYGYAGVNYTIAANLTLNAKGGVQYSDSYNAPGSSGSLSPYGDISLIYTYLPGSYIQVGFDQSQNATDIVAPDASGKITEYQESSVIYASINHKITSKLTGSILGHYQYSEFHEGAYNNESDKFYNVGVNLSYSFNTHLSADLGYNFDYLDSEIPGRDYTRNRVYIGVTAAY